MAACCMHFACGMQMAPWPIPCGTPTKANNLFNTKLLQKLHQFAKQHKSVTNITKMFQTLRKTDWKKTSPHKITTSNT